MNYRLLLRPALGAVIAFSAATAPAASLNGLHLAGPWPNSTLGSRADWSSDLGVDYQYQLNVGQDGNLVGDGQGSWNSNRPIRQTDSDFDLDWELASRGGAAGDTYSGGRVTMGRGGNLDTAGNTKIHLYNHLGANEGGYGISTGSYADSLFHTIQADYEYQPIYWAMEYTIQSNTAGWTQQSVYLRDPDQRNHYLLNRQGYDLSNGTIKGTIYGQLTSWWYFQGITNYSQFTLQSYLGDTAGRAGAGDLSVDLSIRYSTQPIQSVPEPTTMTILGLGALLALRKRRAK